MYQAIKVEETNVAVLRQEIEAERGRLTVETPGLEH